MLDWVNSPPNYYHLAPTDDLHLHSFSRSDNSVVWSPKLPFLIVVFNPFPSHKGCYSSEGTKIKCEQNWLLIYPRP